MKKRIIAVFMSITMALSICGCRQADRVSHNVSKEADNFNVTRKLTVINVLSDSVIQEVIGTFSINTNSNHELEIICKVGDDQYKKHFVYLNSWTVYTVEDISGADVDPYKYEITFYPAMVPAVEIDINKVGILGG